MSSNDTTTGGGPLPRHMSPDQVRNTGFTRTARGRRGFAEDEVERFVHRLADELARHEADKMRLLDENRRLKQAMRDWQSRHVPDPAQDLQQRVTADAAALMAQAQQQRVTADAAALMARAQQHIDAQVAQAELYCRQREQEAVQHYDEIVREARAQAAREADQVARQYRASAGDDYSSDKERVERQRVYLRAMLKALDAVGDHLHATRSVFAVEVTKLDEWLDTPELPAGPALTD